jgi:hypothetical protein
MSSRDAMHGVSTTHFLILILCFSLSIQSAKACRVEKITGALVVDDV